MDKKPRFVGHASEIEKPFRRCTCCDRPLTGQVVWLELDRRTNTFHDAGGVPADQSQGWFPFGMTCGRKANGQPAVPKAKRA